MLGKIAVGILLLLGLLFACGDNEEGYEYPSDKCYYTDPIPHYDECY